MRVLELGMLYLVIGFGCAVLAFKRTEGKSKYVDAPLTLLFWPLRLPALLATRDERAETEGDAQRFLEVLQHIAGTPLAGLLPDASTVRILSGRIALATARVKEIERLLATPEFSEADARERLAKFGPDDPAAAALQSRIQNIVRLRALRDRFASEIEVVRELLGQLRVQAELVRLSGATDSGTRDLVSQVLTRVEGLDSVLAEGA